MSHERSQAYLIYAPNGVMARTIYPLDEGAHGRPQSFRSLMQVEAACNEQDRRMVGADVGW